MSALLWTFPLLMFASIVIGWAAEVTAVHLSAGIALAVLAWLQTAPEFAVEATIAWHRDTHLALANLTGSLRLLLGFGWPMIFFIHSVSSRRRKAKTKVLVLPESFAVEAAGLGIPVIYFLIIYLKNTWTALDGAILCSTYGFYFWMLARQRKKIPAVVSAQDVHEEEEFVVRKVLALPKGRQTVAMLAMFGFGAWALIFTVHPFLDGLKAAAANLGVSDFVFVQWIAPLASEFPEKVTAFNWARKPKRVPYAIVNMLSSVTSQWTLLAGLIPIIFSLSAGHPFTIIFDHFQRTELLLTIAQSALAVALLIDLTIVEYEMIGFFGLWALQFFMPSAREILIYVYFFWAIVEAVRMALLPERCKGLKALRKLF